MQLPDVVSNAVGFIAYHFARLQPFLPTEIHLIASAVFPIYAGAHASLSRPSSAAKPKTKEKDEHGKPKSAVEDRRMEFLSTSDAIMMPILAGCTLTGLYFLIKWLEDPILLNRILNGYFALFSVFSVTNFVSDALDVLHSLLFPHYFMDRGLLYHVNPKQRRAIPTAATSASATQVSSTNPLPSILSRLPLPTWFEGILWWLHTLPTRPIHIQAHLRNLFTIHLKPNIHNIEGFIVALIVVGTYNLTSNKPWILTNLLGTSFAYEALQLMSPGSFKLSTMLLAGLFAYDIYFVFYTPMMVAVATTVDIPVKMVFPNAVKRINPETGQAEKGLSMLGLGDVVLPGMVIGLALRLDLWLHYLKKQKSEKKTVAAGEIPKVMKETQTTQDGESTDVTTISSESTATTEVAKATYEPVHEQWGDRLWTSSFMNVLAPPTTSRAPRPDLSSRFSKPYFSAAMTGYIGGLLVTLGAMLVSERPQPALLYLVPGVLGSIGIKAWWRDEVKQVWGFVDGPEDTGEDGWQDEAAEKDQAKKLTWTDMFKDSIFFKDPLRIEGKMDGTTKKGEKSASQNTHRQKQKEEKAIEENTTNEERSHSQTTKAKPSTEKSAGPLYKLKISFPALSEDATANGSASKSSKASHNWRPASQDGRSTGTNAGSKMFDDGGHVEKRIRVGYE
ncbi:MAG: hypothetical protein M1828_002594 [Chrysothrix sp. TS-e1954]|nr:MAG: hypothetical protein M1828_002594 [Chrysothrix sp. TS-e1954]